MKLHQKLKTHLSNAGLTEAEITVYLELIKKPANNIWELVLRTGLNKNMVYRAFSKLIRLQMVKKTEKIIKAQSLKTLIADLATKERNFGKTAYKLKQLSPFLHQPKDTIEVFETFYTPDQIAEAYLFMAENVESVNLDIGDFENFIPTVGGVKMGHKYRGIRSQKASCHAICTTFGPHTEYFCNSTIKKKYKFKFDLIKLNLKNHFTIFSTKSDYVLFNKFNEEEPQSAVLVKSKPIAELQRKQFDIFSQLLEKD